MDQPSDEELTRYERWIKALNGLHNEGFPYAGAFRGIQPLDVQRRGMLFTAAQTPGDKHLATFADKFPMAPKGVIVELVQALRTRYVLLRLTKKP